MATSKTETQGAQAAPETGTGTGTKIVWDDSRMNTSYANVCNVLGTREEITLLFGANQGWHSGQKEVKVMLSDRVVLNPYAAKRLMMMLEKGLGEYEARYGVLKLEA